MAISTIGANSLAQSRILTAVQQPAGAVLQVVQGTLGSMVSTTTTNTFVTTGLAASITPSSSTSKILATISGTGYTHNSAAQGVYTLYRGATNLSTYGFTTVYANNANIQGGITFSYLDSPATTSSTTYTLYFSLANAAGTTSFNSNSAWGQGNATIILQEISA
jgi:hypothetical protein